MISPTVERRADTSPTGSARKVWVLTADPKTAAAVKAALEGDGAINVGGVCRDLRELAPTLDRGPVPAVVVDIDAQPTQMLHDLEAVIGRFPQTRFVVLSGRSSNELMLEAMQAGARHFVLKQTIETDLPVVLRRLVAGTGRGPAKPEQRGEIVTVFSAGGGCGATTIAVNLANEFHLLTSTPALVVDLDVAYGAVAIYLGVGGEFGVADVLARGGGIDPQLIRSTAQAYTEGLHALVSPATVNPAQPLPLAFEQVEDVLDACRRAYPRTVVDAPRLPPDVAARVARASSCTLIVGQLSVKDIRNARAMRSSLIDRGVAADAIRCVAGRYTKQGMLTRDDAERGLGGVGLDLVCNDWRAASNSINVGEPLAKAAPRSSLRGDIQRLAASLNSRLPSVQSTHLTAAG